MTRKPFHVPARLTGETFTFHMEAGEGAHEVMVALMYDPQDSWRLKEISFVSQGKIGQGIDLMLRDLGIKLSRALQDRDPDSGAAMADPETPPRVGPPRPRAMVAAK